MDRTAALPGKFPAVPAVILAAGRSSRMGRVKALLPWPPLDTPCVVHVTEQLREGGAGPVAVVTGAHHDAIAAVVRGETTVLFNPRHDEGQLTSLQCGLDWAFAGTAEWALVTLVDLPAVDSATVRTLLDAARTTSALAIRPTVGDRHGHPVLWRRQAWPLIRSAHVDGARQVMRQLAATGHVLDLPVEDEAVLRDIDTFEEYLEQSGRRKTAGRGRSRD